MFDIGFSELLLVGIVALVVLGPDRLPGAVRTAGLWIGRIKRSFSAIKAEVEREIGADEIRRQLHNEQILELEREMKAMKESLNAPISTSTSTSAETPTPTPTPTPAEPSRTTDTSTSQDKSPQP
ncbi:Sec-independent protein translocase protein TatB [Pseudomonas anguilliseptica]|uniref:Sec-independent protein translocase protein TatB n=1 Tax=Pseudomonas anguilliseptica TaxID=53406 RepID=UPI001F41416F|nr:Sec-independent protein translocase protein TatB [Pseudomonas anguilliseptica]MCE5364041.1 Sec-independent protein translocase subunit TatB [Pseudomonas anguilliseptica]